jgi:hypothetical protein
MTGWDVIVEQKGGAGILAVPIIARARKPVPSIQFRLEPMGWYLYFLPSKKMTEVVSAPPVSSE